MDIKTLIMGYVPLVDATGRKTREIKEDAYMRELLAQYDLGELHYAHMKDWKEKADQIDPLFIILLGNDYYGKEVRAYKITPSSMRRMMPDRSSIEKRRRKREWRSIALSLRK